MDCEPNLTVFVKKVSSWSVWSLLKLYNFQIGSAAVTIIFHMKHSLFSIYKPACFCMHVDGLLELYDSINFRTASFWWNS